MRRIEDISEHEMVATFLQAEINSRRFGGAIPHFLERGGVERTIIDDPDTTRVVENAYRLQLLGEVRGYRQNRALFEGFPDQVVWQRVALTKDELMHVKYIDYYYWVELSNGSRLATDAAQAIRAGRTVFGVPNDGFLALTDVLRHGAIFPELILVRVGEGAELVVLEGHVRLTAYALALDVVPPELTAILGTCAQIVHWGLY
jgi:hypothetical protein